MKALTVIEHAVARGIELQIDGSDIICGHDAELPEDLVRILRANKAEIVNLMTGGRSHLEAKSPPVPWSEGVASKVAMDPPSDWPPHLWSGTVNNAQWFLERWGATAAALGWTTNDCFGVYDKAPYRRLDFMGLAVGMFADRVAVMLPTEAKLWRDGCRLTYRRKVNSADAVPIWKLNAQNFALSENDEER